MMDDAKDGFFQVSSKLAALQWILYGYRETANKQEEERLAGLVE
jgi:hypothetical protein